MRSKELVNAKTFLSEDKTFEPIVKVCRLEADGDNWKVWLDDAGNKLRIRRNRSLRLYPRQEGRDPTTTTDLFFQSKPEHIARHSGWIHALTGRSRGDRVAFVWFMGHDLRLRAAYFFETNWQYNYPPLLSGIQTLKNVIETYFYDKNFSPNQYTNIHDVDIEPIALMSTNECSNWNKIETWLATIN